VRRMAMQNINGGVCAPKGFLANGIHCGIRKNKSKPDLALIFSCADANAAAVYTTNLAKAAPLVVTREHLKDGKARAIICNSGNANACTSNGMEVAAEMCRLVADQLDIDASDVVVASTGVIGQELPIEPIAAGLPSLVKGLGDSSIKAAEAIMTTDTKLKEIAFSFEIGSVECRIGGIAKGSGMIHPNMATMLAFLTTDCAISSEMLQKALSKDVDATFNMISVDGDTSTNDMVVILANGEAKNTPITTHGPEFDTFAQALNAVTLHLCRAIASDGEGATKLLTCEVSGADTEEAAKKVAKSVISSSLVKTAMFGADANWGRLICAVGYSGASADVSKVDISLCSAKGSVLVCKGGIGVGFPEDKAKEILLEEEVVIRIDLNSGTAHATAWGCDLTYDYVKINGSYRT